MKGNMMKHKDAIRKYSVKLAESMADEFRAIFCKTLSLMREVDTDSNLLSDEAEAVNDWLWDVQNALSKIRKGGELTTEG